MKRRAHDTFGPPSKKQRTSENEHQSNLNTAGWGISDDSEDEDDGIKNHTNTNNGHKTMQSNDTNHTSNYSNVAQKMMQKMGYIQGQSLGNTATNGITEPIQAYSRLAQRGGLGFEHKLSNFDSNASHTYESEKIEIEISPVWLDKQDSSQYSVPTTTEFESYLQFKPRCDRVGLEWNATFCSLQIQKDIFRLKSEFDEIGQTKLFLEARNKSNPFEGIKREIFQNRAALKLCEMDRNLNYLLTQPNNGVCITFNKECKQRQSMLINAWKCNNVSEISLHGSELWTRELLYFADLCSGPGGFSEYFLHINKWQCRGWGFTLRNSEDFKLHKFNSNAPWDNFTPEYGIKGNGNICDNDNLSDFRTKVVSVSMKGCHTVMSDGGFDCHPNYNSQELLSRQLVLCQFICAVSILRTKGVFVMKLFDCFHPFTASVIYIASLMFEEIGLMKPNQSRPANSERYLICKGFIAEFGQCNTWNAQTLSVNKPHFIVRHLLDINMIINKGNKELKECKSQSESESDKSALKEVCPLVPIDKMEQTFVDWLKGFNESNGLRQIRHLGRIKKYLEDKHLRIDDQIQIRKRALQHWFHTAKGERFIVLDPQFGSRYVTKYEDYNNHSNLHRNNGGYNSHGHHGSNAMMDRELRTLITNKELLQRITFEFESCITPIAQGGYDWSDFRKYHMRGDWFSVAFEFSPMRDKCAPKWVTLVSSGNRQIFECVRNRDSPPLMCVSKTNDLMRLPADTVIDCIKTHSIAQNSEVYHIFDCWVIGSKSLYKRNFIQRQEFCRVLYQGYGSKYIKFAGARPAMQSLSSQYILKNHKHIYLWFIRNKKSVEQNSKAKSKNRNESMYWRPCAVKVWNGNNAQMIPFQKLLQTLEHINKEQMLKREKMNRHSTFIKK